MVFIPHGGSLQIVPMSLWSAARRLSETSLSLLILAIYVFVLVENKLAALRYVALRCAALRCVALLVTGVPRHLGLDCRDKKDL